MILRDENMNNIKNFVERENARIEQEKQASLTENGFTPFFKIPEGESELRFLDVEPVVNKQYTDRIIFAVVDLKSNPELTDNPDMEYSLSVNIKSPLYKDIISALNQGHDKLKILRIGTSKTDTRYSVKPIM